VLSDEGIVIEVTVFAVTENEIVVKEAPEIVPVVLTSDVINKVSPVRNPFVLYINQKSLPLLSLCAFVAELKRKRNTRINKNDLYVNFMIEFFIAIKIKDLLQ